MPVHRPSAPGSPPPSCQVSSEILCHGPIETSVFAVAGSAGRPGGRSHIGVKYGRVLIYLEDRHALDTLSRAVGQATEMASAVFGPIEDAFAEVEAAGRRRFERTGEVTHLR